MYTPAKQCMNHLSRIYHDQILAMEPVGSFQSSKSQFLCRMLSHNPKNRNSNKISGLKELPKNTNTPSIRETILKYKNTDHITNRVFEKISNKIRYSCSSKDTSFDQLPEMQVLKL